MNRAALDDSFYGRPVLEVAPDLLNKVLVVGDCAARVVEVEAYGGEADAGSHAWRGPTPRTQIMYGPPGHWYLYLSYGVHWCANVVVDRDGTASAVLLRGVEPLAGEAAMFERRGRVARRNLANGPGKLTQAMAMKPELNGQHIASSAAVIVDDGMSPPGHPIRTPRIGLSENRAPDIDWRFVVG